MQIFKISAFFSVRGVISSPFFSKFGENVSPTETRAAFLGSQVAVPAVQRSAGGGNPQPAEDEILIMVSIMVSIEYYLARPRPHSGGRIEPAEREATARPFYMQIGAAKGQQIEKENRTELCL